MSLLSADEFDIVRDLAMAAKLFQQGFRDQLLDGIDENATGFIPPFNPPIPQLSIDLRWVSEHERLADGSVPLLRWLKNAARLTKPFAQGAALQRWADTVSSRAAGEPVIAVVPSETPVVTVGATMMPLPELKESILFENTIIPYGFFHGGEIAGRSVAHLSVPIFEGQTPVLSPTGAQAVFHGTGWVLAGTYVLTNHHVVNARAQGVAAASAPDFQMQGTKTTIRFDYDDEAAGGERFASAGVQAWDAGLDYALLRTDAAHNRPALRRRTGSFEMTSGNIPVNIIQHPDGGPKMIAIRNNLVTKTAGHDVCYLTDTKFGSSGSPVFDDRWNVVALHRGSVIADSAVTYFNRSTLYVNIGTQITSILDHIQANFPAVWANLG